MKTLVYFLVAGVTLTIFVKFEVTSLSCFCGSSPCETPKCCESGSFALDACGCCPICAKGTNDTCGGPFRTAGNCDVGLSCVKKCTCKTEKGLDCIFPFKFKGNTYNTCTDQESANNKTWCATELDDEGVVINGKWDDCDFGCPSEGNECDSTYFFNSLGRCMDKSDAQNIMDRSDGGVEVEEGLLEADVAPPCQTTPEVNHCRCSDEPLSSLTGSKTGKPCEPVSSNVGSELSGWCFLNNIKDPSNPAENCHEDVKWSESHGRFWSNLACRPSIIVEGRTKIEDDYDYEQPTKEDGFIDESQIIFED